MHFYLLLKHGRCNQIVKENIKKKEMNLWKNVVAITILIYFLFLLQREGFQTKIPFKLQQYLLFKMDCHLLKKTKKGGKQEK
ncbi:hypothetical protein RFI_34320 [Reticulomyxa filosa]|uniref:Uncharacterized protein n=1 Tax=Reticulomyxa filosa TaxID=46433 RepID=X6LQR8_RETFI|nr:hypothetical protein RFI_34320 [Reticulomyxa filosa]|eukprot:ETO03090.1 hypothetical protein RFI_34320 [Reticulomyxa filosa]